MLNLTVIKTNDGYLITMNQSVLLESYFFDGVKPQKTFKYGWYKLKSKPEKIEIETTQPPINKRFELKPEFLNSGFKPIWLHNEAYDEDYDVVDEFVGIKGLYNYIEDKQPNIFKNIDFTWDEILEIETFKEPTGFSYKVAGNLFNKINPDVTEKSLKYDILTEVLTPNILLHTQPCKLSAYETYGIIRKFIKENINPKVAEITSDYDFCFTVKKKIPLSKPYTFEVDVNNSIFDKRKRKPKFETRWVRDKFIEIFEMTHNGYKGYTQITPFEAENQDALKEYIDTYLNTLINVINEPVCECEKCSGTGVLFKKV